jgi:hypothetical protein
VFSPDRSKNGKDDAEDDEEDDEKGMRIERAW